jgi:hypothetical protein
VGPVRPRHRRADQISGGRRPVPHEGVDSTFVFLFALYSHPHRPDGDPRDDLDLASIGIVKVLEGRNGNTYPDMPWEPKAAFAAVADHYAVGAAGATGR